MKTFIKDLVQGICYGAVFLLFCSILDLVISKI